MAWRTTSGLLKNALGDMESAIWKEDGRYPISLEEGYPVREAYKNFSNLVNNFPYESRVNNLRITANPTFFPKGYVDIKRKFTRDADVFFELEPTEDHFSRILGATAETLKDKKSGGRIRIVIPHSVDVGGNEYTFYENMRYDAKMSACIKDICMPKEILTRKSSRISDCNVDMARGDKFEEELENYGKIAEAVAIKAKGLGYNVALKEMEKNGIVVGCQFCIPSLPMFPTYEDILVELEKQEGFVIEDTLAGVQEGELTFTSPPRKISGTYRIFDKNKSKGDIFGCVGTSVLSFDGLEQAAFDEKYTRAVTGYLLHQLSNAKGMAATIYNSSGLPDLIDKIHPIQSYRQRRKAKEEENAERERKIYDEMRRAGFVKPKKTDGTESGRCIIILNEDAFKS